MVYLKGLLGGFAGVVVAWIVYAGFLWLEIRAAMAKMTPRPSIGLGAVAGGYGWGFWVMAVLGFGLGFYLVARRA